MRFILVNKSIIDYSNKAYIKLTLYNITKLIPIEDLKAYLRRNESYLMQFRKPLHNTYYKETISPTQIKELIFKHKVYNCLIKHLVPLPTLNLKNRA